MFSPKKSSARKNYVRVLFSTISKYQFHVKSVLHKVSLISFPNCVFSPHFRYNYHPLKTFSAKIFQEKCVVRASFWKLYSLFYSTSKLSVDVESVVRESYIKVTIYLSPFYFENENGFRELDSTLKEGEIF